MKKKYSPKIFLLCVLTIMISSIIFSCKKNTKPVIKPPRLCFKNIDNQVIIDLNDLTYTIANQHDQFNSFIGVRSLALVHLSIHDIFNAIEPKYQQFHYKEKTDVCEPIAAAIESTRIILTDIYPNKKDTIIQVCNKWLSTILEGEEKAKSMYLGRIVANSYLKFRKNDGHDRQGDYTPTSKPGDYQYTPGFLWVQKPDFSAAKSFTLDSISQFRSPKPPILTSDEYTVSYNEVMEYGIKGSKVRSEDQTNIAHWWAELGEHSWNKIGRFTAADKKLPIIETNRMFALLNMNLYDMYLVSSDSKYHYNTWRPYTAILEGKNDGNDATKGNAKWEPEMRTPPRPEYPSMHVSAGVSGVEILNTIYDTKNVSYKIESVTALPNAKERNYTNLDKVIEDFTNSMIMNGYHFRFSIEEGKKQGKKVARHTIENFLQPIK